jgi:lipopolysaccharide biosynthesis regulator YciM
MCTGPLTQAGLWNEARSRLRGLDDETLTEPQSVLRNQALATCELQFDEIDAAERAIARIARPADESIEVWLVALEALLLALRGEPERALARLGTQQADDNPSLRASHRLVRAHIMASREDEEAAIAELELLRQEAGRRGLERVIRPRGPASALAERLLQAHGQSG